MNGPNNHKTHFADPRRPNCPELPALAILAMRTPSFSDNYDTFDGAGRPISMPPHESPAARPETAPARRRGLKVLIIEDNTDAADSLALLLELLGHEARIARDGLSGVAAVADYRPDVILCDIGLPGLDGYQIARRLRGQPSLCPRMLIALTGYGQDEDRRRALAAGFDRHYTKPADPEELISLLDGVSRQMDTDIH